MATSFFGAAQDALDVHLGPEPDDVGGFGQLLTRLVPGGQWRPGVGVGEGLGSAVPDREPLVGVNELVMGGPPHLVIRRRGDRFQFGAGDGAADGGVEVRGAAFLGCGCCSVAGCVRAPAAPGGGRALVAAAIAGAVWLASTSPVGVMIALDREKRP